MWTNVFKIGGLQQVSWFQLLPADLDGASLSDKSANIEEQRDTATRLVLSAHVRLKNEGYLTAWTNSFVGPWDPSQGIHNPDEKIKLWLFLPGRVSNIAVNAQAAISGLKVVASGLWCAPGDSEEFALAFSQALRSRIERAFRGLSYMRFGDAFVKLRSFVQDDRRPLFTCEFIFSASEEAIFVHVICSSKRVRTLSNSDFDEVLSKQSHSQRAGEHASVFIAPHGMRGKLTGCCPSDLANRLYYSKLNGAKESAVASLPFHLSYSFQKNIRGQTYYAEVSLGCLAGRTGSVEQTNIELDSNKEGCDVTSTVITKEEGKQEPENFVQLVERTFIYPPEAVLVPMVPVVPARTYLRRCWLRDWAGTSWLERGSLAETSCSYFSTSGSGVGMGDGKECLDSSWIGSNGLHLRNSSVTDSSSSSSTCSSRESASSSESDAEHGIISGDTDADADSLISKQSHLTSANQLDTDVSKAVLVGKHGHWNGPESLNEVVTSKKSRIGESADQNVAGTLLEKPTCDTTKSGCTSKEPTTVVGSSAALLMRDTWEWPDGDPTISIDVLDEFGDFGDFFEDDPMLLGEPPGSTESQDFMLGIPNGGDGMDGTDPQGLDTTDQMLMPIFDFTCLHGFEQQLSTNVDIVGNKEGHKDSRSSQGGSQSSGPSTSEVDSLPKSEAMLMYAPEYTPVDKPKNDINSFPFKNPYIPESRRLRDSKTIFKPYIYSATPPCSPGKDTECSSKVRPDCKSGVDKDLSAELKNFYTQVMPGRLSNGKYSVGHSKTYATKRKDMSFSSIVGFPSSKIGVSVQSKTAEEGLGNGGFLMIPQTVLATEVECAMLQASMCRIRHMLLTGSRVVRFGSNKLSIEPLLTQLSNTSQCHSTNLLLTNVSNNEQQKKEIIPVRIAGDTDEEMHDGPPTAQVGVWRPVGTPKLQKMSTVGNESVNMQSSLKSEEEKPFVNAHKQGSSIPCNETGRASSYVQNDEEKAFSNLERQPLYELLVAIPMLVQQATAFTDIILDGDSGDGPFTWLAFNEQQRRRFSCGPATIHAGCGGALAACHSYDTAGVELPDPLFADINPADVANLLYSDVRLALKSAFGDGNLDGPLLVTEWCKGRVHSGEGSNIENYSGDCAPNDSKESSSTITMGLGEPITPPQNSAVCSVNFKPPSIAQIESQICEVQRGNKNWAVESINVAEDASQKRVIQDLDAEFHSRPTFLALPNPALLVGYQDDWLKTSSAALQLWEKAPFEPYARPKPVLYYVVCPNIDTLLSASVDFLLQLSTVYEACKLGTHASVNTVGVATTNSGRWASAGVVPVECPQQLQKKAQNLSFVASVNDYLSAVEKGWEVSAFCKSLSEALRGLPLGTCSSMHQKENESGSCTVIYVICPFADPAAVIQTVVESCHTIGTIYYDKEKLLNYGQIEKAQDLSSVLDEAVTLLVPTLFGYSMPKIVLQILTLEMILKISKPPISESIALKEIAFTVYNKARRISRSTPTCDSSQAAAQSFKLQSGSIHMSSSVPGVWKDFSITPTNTGPTSLARDSLLDTGCLRSNAWENSWQTVRQGDSLLLDSSVPMGSTLHDDVRYLFEPLFILAEPGSIDQGISLMSNACTSESGRSLLDETLGNAQSSISIGQGDVGPSTVAEVSESETAAARNKKAPNLHCCYGWTEDWQWLVCVWTDARGELLDVHVFPFGGISGRQDTKGLESLFIQVLQQGLQLLCLNPDMGACRPSSIVIARIGCFYELECNEWQKAIIAVGGHEVKKWPLQLRRFASDGNSASAAGGTLQQQEISLMQERTLPSSPSPSSSIYASHSKVSHFGKSNIGQANTRKHPMSVNAQDVPKSAFQWIQGISLVALSIDHALQLICPNDLASQGGNQHISSTGLSSLVEGLNLVKTLSSTAVSHLLVPSHGVRFLPPLPLQLPTCLTAESPPLAHLLHSKGYAFPFSTSFVVSKATPSIRRESMQYIAGEEWPSTLMVSLIDHYGATTTIPINHHSPESIGKSKPLRTPQLEGKDYQVECHQILESLASEINALSWLSASPAFQDRRTALPIHCDMVLRLQRLIYFAGKEFQHSTTKEKNQSLMKQE